MTNHQLVFDWMSKFGQEIPESLTMPNLETRRLRASLIFEEALECVAALGFCIKARRIGYTDTYVFLNPELTDYNFIDEQSPNIENILDGLVDLDWMNKGTLVAMGVSEELLKELEAEVYRSNCSKLWTEEEVIDKFGVVQIYEQSKGSDTKGNYYEKITTFILNPTREDLVNHRCYLVKSHLGKVLKSPSYSKVCFKQILDKYLVCPQQS